MYKMFQDFIAGASACLVWSPEVKENINFQINVYKIEYPVQVTAYFNVSASVSKY